jgi:hypothetical protein
MVAQDNIGVLLEPGFGKTRCALEAFARLRRAGKVRTMLVVAPLKPLYHVWRQEAAKWGYSFKFAFLHGPAKALTLHDSDRADIYLINYEGLPWLCEQSGWHFDVFCADELTKLKHHNTNRFKALKPFLSAADGYMTRHWGLTGSAGASGLLHLWGQMYVLDQGEALGRYVTHYRNKYFYQSGYGGYTWTPFDGADRLIFDRIRGLVIRFTDPDLKLPKLEVMDPVAVELPAKAQRVYAEMEAEQIALLERGEIVAGNAAAVTIKLRQMVAGAVYDAEHVAHHVHDAKLDALVELLDQLDGQPALIAYEFRHELEAFRRKFGKDIPALYGRQDEDEAGKFIAQWNEGKLPYLFVQSSSNPYGLNLQNYGRAVIWYTLTYGLEFYEQLL